MPLRAAVSGYRWGLLGQGHGRDIQQRTSLHIAEDQHVPSRHGRVLRHWFFMPFDVADVCELSLSLIALRGSHVQPSRETTRFPESNPTRNALVGQQPWGTPAGRRFATRRRLSLMARRSAMLPPCSPRSMCEERWCGDATVAASPLSETILQTRGDDL